MKQRFRVTGMTCAACAARVERAAVRAGAENVSVNLLIGTLDCDLASSDAAAVIGAVEKAGYGASLPGAVSENVAAKHEKSPCDDRRVWRRVAVSACFLLPLMAVSMYPMLPHPRLFDTLFGGGEGAMLWGLSQLLLCLPVLLLNRHYYESGFRNLFRLAPNMDSLIALGSSVSALYSVVSLLRIAWASGRGMTEAAATAAQTLYFDSAAMILVLITVGKALEARAKRKTTEALTALTRLSPKTALVLRDGKECEIPVSALAVGDTVILKPGATAPCDGTVLDGNASLDQSAVTGESVPADKEKGDSVISASLCKEGYLRFRAERVGGDTTLAQVIRLVEEASAGKAPIARLADRICRWFVPAVIGIAALTFTVWLIAGASVPFALRCGISVLVISCPCALGLATPVAIMVGTGKGAGIGILIRSGEALETLGRVDTVVLDKTGTLTVGEPKVASLVPLSDGMEEKDLLALAASLERYSEHPLAAAIVRNAEEQGSPLRSFGQVTPLPGRGIEGTAEDGSVYRIGNLRWLTSLGMEEDALKAPFASLQEKGQTPVLLVRDLTPIGIVSLSDTLRPTSREAIETMKHLHLTPVLLTGDNEHTAHAAAEALGITQVIADVLPAQKEAVIARLTEEGKRVAMVGDGINDAPALARAEVGIAIGAGTDAAIGSADAVLMRSDPMDICDTVRLSRAVMRNIRENLFWAFFYNCIGIPLAAGALYPAFGLQLSPMIGAAAMSLSSLCVVTNALRLRSFRPLKLETVSESNQITKRKGGNPMKKTLKIDGMMCPKCVAHVKKALTAVEGVSEAEVTLDTGLAVVTLSSPVTDAALKSAVEEEGYTVLSIA